MSRSYSSFLFWLGMTIVASVMLYHTSDRVNELDRQLRALNAQIDAEQQSMHVLKAEWVYLANPARVEAEAGRHLNLQPTAPRRVAAMRDIGSLLPLRNGTEPVFASRVVAPAAPETGAKTPVETPVAAAVTHNRHDRVASVNSGHINDHMIMQHTAAIGAPVDRIGALIGTLGLHP